MKWRRTHSRFAPGARAIAVAIGCAGLAHDGGDVGRKLGAPGGFRIASASNPISTPMVASSAMRSRPVIGSPPVVCFAGTLPPEAT